MSIRLRNGIYHYYFREGKKQRDLSLGTRDYNEAMERATVLEEQRRATAMQLRFKGVIESVALRSQAATLDSSIPSVSSCNVLNVAPQVSERQVIKQEKVQGEEDVKINTALMTFDDMYDIAIKYRTSIGKRHHQIWQKFKQWCIGQGISFVQHVTSSIAQRFMSQNFDKLKGKTYNTSKGLLNVIFKAALVNAGMNKSPFEILLNKPLNDEEHYRNFTMAECKAIIANAAPYWKCLSIISLYTGLRLETCRKLAPCHIKDGIITVMPGKTARYGREVAIPVLPELDEYLSSLAPIDENTPYCNSFEEVVYWTRRKVDAHGKIIVPCVYYFAGLLQSLGINDKKGEKAAFHSFRCTFITILSEYGISETVISGMVGHTDKKMTRLYNHDTKSAMAILDIPRFNVF